MNSNTIYIHEELKFHKHVSSAVSKANQTLYIVKRTFDTLEILDQLEGELDGKQNISLDYGKLDKEIYDTIKDLKNKKSTGPDGIINEMLKCGTFY